ncbi:MAG: sigma-70 family RNA polymerase sigma factor [Gemmataceae bacterium]|nr:sigma-70 family RNA polymerase sigma factor [Gemmataceae bacterium]
MATSRTSEIIQHVYRAVLVRAGTALTDSQLLEGFVNRRDSAAIAALVRRHGPMVWGVCRRVLDNHHDAEDAFQATFLVLVRKAASITSPELLANWLYGVAHQTALKARATTAKKWARERQVTEMPETAVTEQELWNDLQPLLDQELSRLPDNYRVAIVLCDLEGKTRKEAAQQLGVPDGTLAARLARGRVLLAKRLARHGLIVSGGVLAVVLAQNAALASTPNLVVSSTIKAASLFATGQAAAMRVISANVAALTEGVVKTMLLTKLKITIAMFLLTALACWGVSTLTHTSAAQIASPEVAIKAEIGPQSAQAALRLQLHAVRWYLLRMDADNNTIQVSDAPIPPNSVLTFAEINSQGKRIKLDPLQYVGQLGLESLPVARNAKITVDGKVASLKDLRAWMQLTLWLAEDKTVVTAIEAVSPPELAYVLVAVNAAQRSISLAGEKGVLLRDVPVAKDAYIYLNHKRDEGQLPDLEPGMRVALRLTVAEGRFVVREIRATK